VQIVLTFWDPGYGSLAVAAFTLTVILEVIAAPVKAAVAADNLRKDRLAILGLRVVL
jgi:hypothetical protein